LRAKIPLTGKGEAKVGNWSHTAPRKRAPKGLGNDGNRVVLEHPAGAKKKERQCPESPGNGVQKPGGLGGCGGGAKVQVGKNAGRLGNLVKITAPGKFNSK